MQNMGRTGATCMTVTDKKTQNICKISDLKSISIVHEALNDVNSVPVFQLTLRFRHNSDYNFD